ncbi:hypothetical protein VB834_19885 [Limnoraphis robusta Tam1]|uniref:hypothetical protein n=1 Tax=Limnoraphis robusta TaxID=1118279 RepID=UPI002B209777|nr:hypothetical protein [Limnoraphis robusta]MEA5496861.1 hypothetical protein [Limnoraphis robusta BA-68 BA1]MEA5541291.1 hypothetical protein [Limnoraphis robusta Tam1]
MFNLKNLVNAKIVALTAVAGLTPLIAQSALAESTKINSSFERFENGVLITQGTTNPGTSPTTNPGTSPTTNPGTSPTTNPGTSPTTNPGTSPTTNPGEVPTTNPGTSPTNRPGTSPTNRPGTSPTNRPGTSPTNRPGTSPTNRPGTSPNINPNQQRNSPSQPLNGGDNSNELQRNSPDTNRGVTTEMNDMENQDLTSPNPQINNEGVTNSPNNPIENEPDDGFIGVPAR